MPGVNDESTIYIANIGRVFVEPSEVEFDGPHHGSSAGRNFHNKLIKDLAKAKTKSQALSVIDSHHRSHMKLGGC